MLSDTIIQENKQTFLDLIRNIKREGANVELLVKQLQESDFFEAPASTRFHAAYPGGLCDHSLNVFFNLKRMVENKGLTETYDETTLIIVALLHDFSKMNFYEPSAQNKKVYSETGTKKDELGNFDWVSIRGYKVRESSNRFIFASHGQTAEYMVRRFIPLTCEESVAIINHMGGFDSNTSVGDNLTDIYNRYPLAALLHAADFISTYIDERI